MNDMSQSASFYIRPRPSHLTYVLLASNLLVFVAMVAYGYWAFGTWNGTEYQPVLVFFGAKVNELIIQGELWRLGTAMFIHIGVMHLIFNLWALNMLGPLVEGYFGHWRFAAIYLVGGLFGSLASYAFSPVMSAGASGAIFGLAGATTVYFLRYRENFGQRGRAILQNMVVVIGLNIAFGLAQSGIDNWGHVGGLIGGALLAWGLLPRYKAPDTLNVIGNVTGPQMLGEEERGSAELTWVLLCCGLLWFGIDWATRGWLS